MPRRSFNAFIRATHAVGCALFSAITVVLPASGAELPTPCIAGSCGPTGPASFVSSGAATAVIDGNALNVTQSTRNAVLNWESFNISADAAVDFSQPDAASVAVNRIFQSDPSRIFGALTANGQIFLINRNGILFGESARVDVGGLVASTLNITPEALENGIAQAATDRRPAFELFRDSDGNVLPSGTVAIARGATLEADGGQILVFAPEIVNQGTLRTPDGQTLLAAGESVFLLASTDPSVRGLLVEVGVGGTVTNGSDGNTATSRPEDLIGQIVAERGNVTLAGLAVNQLGRVSATTSVRSNGSVRLLARDGGRIEVLGGGAVSLLATRGGELNVGTGSRTSVMLDADADETQIDVNAQVPSSIELEGSHINVLSGAEILATGGKITATARSNPQASPDFFSPEPDESRIYVAAGATVDVSGAQVELPVERNVVRVELRGNELRDSPEQRDGPLRGQPVFVDIRRSGARADGTTWQGTPLADVSGAIATIGRTVAERSVTGGSIALRSQGDVIVAPGARLDVSGGAIHYTAGLVSTSQLLGTDGRVYDISTADPLRSYVGMADSVAVEHPRWGVTEVFTGFHATPQGHFEPGYVEGKDAGTVSILAPRSILDGDVTGHVTVGPYQREPSRPLSPGQVRPFDQLPLGASLILGNSSAGSAALPNYVLGDVSLDSGSILPGLMNGDGSPFNPLTDALPDELSVSRLRPELLADGGVARLQVFSTGSISVPMGVQLRFAPGGELSLIGGVVDVQGAISIPSGSVTLRSQPTETTPVENTGLRLASSARIDAQGQWVNDNPALVTSSSLAAPLLIDGGTVRLSAQQGSAVLEPGSLIDVSGGAWQRSDGRVRPGRGGSISVSVTPATELANPVSLLLGSELRAFAFARGGSLSVIANAVCIASLDCTSGDASAVWLRPGLFSDYGFDSFAIGSNRGGLSVAPGTQISLRQRNLELVGDHSLRPSGTDLRTFTRTTLLDDRLRSPVDLTLTASLTQGTLPWTAESFATAADLSVGAGAAIVADPGASLALRSSSRIVVDGLLSAPAGRISLDLNAGLFVSEFLPSQGIWLGGASVLDARGTTQLRVDDRGFTRGDVLEGGSVSVEAQRGYVIASPGSVIDVSGTAAEVDIGPRGIDASGGVVRQRVASDGGSIVLSAAEGLFASGRLIARAGDGPHAAGGELSIVLDAGHRVDPGQSGPLFPTVSRTVLVSADAAPTVIAPRSAVPGTLNGRASLGVSTVVDGGFSVLHLAARNIFTTTGGAAALRSTGEVRFEGTVALALGRRLTLEAAALTGTSGAVSLAAPYVALGSSDRWSQATPDTLRGGSAAFDVEAGFIELIGHSTLQGFERVRLSSRGDLRLRGVQPLDARSISGSLRTAASLTLAADQTYASTLSRFDVAVEGNPEGVLRIEAGGERDAVLSAGSDLRLSAPVIEHAGVLRAPFGSITMQAQDLRLHDGSLTSTSADGLTIPFGTTQGGFDWVYELMDGQTLVYGDGQRAPPAQRIELGGTGIDVRYGAVLDLSGGGELIAYEFVPGVGGSRDILSPTERPDQFAIIPGLDLGFAPFDQREYEGSGVLPGDSVYLSGIEGLPAGSYALLPARYALLPGAFLVTAVDGYRDIAAGERYPLLDGSTVIAGYYTTAGTDFRESRSRGFVIAPGESARRQAQYDASIASAFFARQAADRDSASPRLPLDAGLLALRPGRSLSLEGSLLAQAIESGRGPAVDVSGDRLRIVRDEGSESGDGEEVRITDSSLVRLGAESLLLGGTRTRTDDGTQINVSSQQLQLDAGTALAAPEIILAATDRVVLDPGATLGIVAGQRAGNAETLRVDGNGALLRASSGGQVHFERSGGDGSIGTLQIAAGARVSARNGSVLLDASRDTSFAGDLDVAGGSLNLSAAQITLGDVTGPTSGLVLSAGDLGRLSLTELVLTSRSALDLFGNVDLSVNRLAVEAAGLRGTGENAAGRLTAVESITLSNPGDLALDGGSGAGLLELSAAEIRLGEGPFAVSGFSQTRLRADERLIGTGSGRLTVDGDLSIRAGMITTTSGATREIRAAGEVAISASAPSGSTALSSVASALDFGGQLSILGERINHSGTIEMRSGVVKLAATGDSPDDGIVLGSGAVIDTSGASVVFDSVPAYAPGGRITLSAARGGVRTEAGSLLDVSGSPEGGGAGAIVVDARRGTAQLQGDLKGSAAEGFAGGGFAVDAQSFGEFSALLRQLNAGGFTEALLAHQRGAGDIVLAAGADNVVRARDVSLIADAGSIRLSGAIDARGADGGRVLLAASDSVEIDGRITVSAREPGGRGGSVALQAANGRVRLGTASIIDVGDGASTGPGLPPGGTVSIRLPREAVLSVLDGDSANDRLSVTGAIVGSTQTTIEGYAAYDLPTGMITDTEVAASADNLWFGEAAAFMANAGAVRTALGWSDGPTFGIRPGIEIRSAGGLSLEANWNLFDWRFDGAPGVLTLRAGGDLSFNQSLSDGFRRIIGTGAFTLATTPAESWSYHLIGGADFSSADPLSVLRPGDVSTGSGSVLIAAGGVTFDPSQPSDFRMVRTGTGDISIRAAGDFTLGNQASALYTAGTAGPGIRLSGAAGLGGRAYPVDGGDLSVVVQGDLRGAPSNQLVTDWLWRVGSAENSDAFSPSATAWTVNFQRFEQGIGVLGGGNLTLSAGNDIELISASIPSIGRQVGGTTPGQSVVEVVGGGNLSVSAGGSILGGSYFVGLGSARLTALDSIAAAATPTVIGPIDLAPILALGDGHFELSARRDVSIETVLNPTLLPQGASQNVQDPSYFSTYGAGSGVNLISIAGDALLVNQPNESVQLLTSMVFGGAETEVGLKVYPPHLTAVALRGDVEVGGSMTLFPAAKGNLQLFAAENVLGNATTGVEVFLSDADPTFLPGISAPQTSLARVFEVLSTPASGSPNLFANIPVHADANQPDGLPDLTPARVVALNGSIVLAPETLNDQSGFYFSKPARLFAGEGIQDVTLVAQNLREGDITSVIAGRDIVYSAQRNAVGSIVRNNREIAVDGPGSVQLIAGRNVDFQTAGGVSTRGDLRNPALPDSGASLSILTGFAEAGTATGAALEAFIGKYLERDVTYAAALIAYVEARTGAESLTAVQALASFRDWAPTVQLPLIEAVLFNELRASGRAAASSGSGDFRRGFEALVTLFPGSNPDVEAGESNPYSGDINLYFSRAYTLDGGGLSLLAPGGEINAGLATPPASLGVSKLPSELGIVAQAAGDVSALSYGDFLVNESRVFAADGGSILVWSTGGDIDAGRGAKTAISAPPPIITFDPNGNPEVTFPAALTGSGIQTLATTPGRKPGDVDLFAPRGVVNAGDAGIVAGNLTIAATAVLGADNIQVSGTAVGVPVDTGGLGASLAAVSSVASSASSAATDAVATGPRGEESEAPLAESALSWLDVFVVGFGEEVCAPDDIECIKRNQKNAD